MPLGGRVDLCLAAHLEASNASGGCCSAGRDLKTRDNIASCLVCSLRRPWRLCPLPSELAASVDARSITTGAVSQGKEHGHDFWAAVLWCCGVWCLCGGAQRTLLVAAITMCYVAARWVDSDEHLSLDAAQANVCDVKREMVSLLSTPARLEATVEHSWPLHLTSSTTAAMHRIHTSSGKHVHHSIKNYPNIFIK